MTAAEWIATLALEPHPEGGHYRETYRSADRISKGALPSRYAGNRSFGTSIYFLLRTGEVSALHRIVSDELWYFHEGSPLTLEQIDPEGAHTSTNSSVVVHD